MSTTGSPPPVTIGVPVFNGERFLAEALTSLQAQDFTDFEVVIADNASTDGTEEIARAFAATDDRFVYLRNAENIGGARNSNLLVDRARSPLFRWAYHDDVCAPELLGRSVAALDASPDAVAAWPRVRLIDEAGRVVGEHQDADLDLTDSTPHRRLEVILRRVVGQVQFGLIRTEVLRAAGGAKVHVAGEMVLPVALAVRGPLVAVPGQLLSIRVHEERHGGDRRSELAWVDPNRPRMPFPYSRSSWLLLQAVRDAGLSSAEERRCAAVIAWWWTRPGWRSIVGDLLRLPVDLRR